VNATRRRGADGGRPSEPVELAPSESAGQQVAMSAMGRARTAVLTALKTRGEATAEQLATELGITVGAVRQQLGPLSQEGLLAYRDERPGPGRPRRWYCLTPAAESLFPKRYGQLTNQLLGFIEETDPSLVSEAFVRRSRQREERARERLDGRPFDERVRELARILDEDGYLAECEPIDAWSWRITELNCAILDVARQHREACGSELAFLRSVLPEASVERVTHILAGGHACSYEVRRQPDC
jgi:DeoR family transcriptional regulator, suf operon transcriptional repressor